MKSSSKSIFVSLYEEAEDENDQQISEDEFHSAKDLSPLYHALERVEKRYSKEELIGEGGMKEVFRVYDEQTERYVALTRPKKRQDPGVYDAFLREAHMTARLEHPNIIKLFDMGIDDELRPYFTMEFKCGLSLRAILANLKAGKLKDKYSYERRLSSFLRVCEAMSYAHSRHVLHLDLKPENIQVGTFGEVQVCDWGMGEIQRGDSEVHFSEALLDPDLYGDQLEGGIKGTPGYMSPEQLNPKTEKTELTDIYALGCLLYELSTLQSPSLIAKKPPESPAISAIVTKACAHNPEDRYASVVAMREDVERHLLGYSPKVEDAAFFREAKLFYRRNKLPCNISLCFTAIIALSAILFIQRLSQSYGETTNALELTESALLRAESAKSLAKQHLVYAEKSRDVAEETLVKYESQHNFSTVLLRMQGGTAIDNSMLLLDFLIMNDAISLAAIDSAMASIDNALLASPPKTDRIWSQKAYSLFMVQRFAEAEKFYAIRPGSQGDLRSLIPEFAPLVGSDGLLPVDDLIRLLQKISKGGVLRAPLVEKILIFDCLKRRSLSDNARVIEVVLKLSNRNWDVPVFSFDHKKSHLIIGGNGLGTLYRPGVPKEGATFPSLCLLRLLKLHSLELASGGFNDLTQLNGLKIRQIDISQSSVKELGALVQLPSLRELIVNEGQFAKVELEKLGASVKVIYK